MWMTLDGSFSWAFLSIQIIHVYRHKQK
jgi:hypothetical protein